MRLHGYAWCLAVAAAIGCSSGKPQAAKEPEKNAAAATSQASTPATSAKAAAAGTLAEGAVKKTSAPAWTSTSQSSAAPSPVSTVAPPAAAAAAIMEKPAAGEPGPKPPFLLPSFVAALHVRPARLLATPIVSRMLPVLIPPEETRSGQPIQLASFFQFSTEELPTWPPRLREVDDLWLFLDSKPAGRSPAGFMAVVRGRSPISAEAVRDEWIVAYEWSEGVVEGKKFLFDPKSDEYFGTPFSVHQVDARTVVVGPQAVLLAVLAAPPAEGPLAELAARPFPGQFRAFGSFLQVEAKLPGVAEQISRTAPPSIRPLADVVPTLRSASLQVDLQGAELVSIEADLVDPAAAAALKKSLTDLWAEAKPLLGAAAQGAEASWGPEYAAVLRETQEGFSTTEEGAAVRAVLLRPEKLPAALDAYLTRTLPAMQAQRRKVQSVNNVRNVILAMQQHEASSFMPPVETLSKKGEPLLSWRAQILPYVERGDLYRAMAWDQAWDGPKNKKLGEARIKVLESTGSPPGRTAMCIIVGPGTLHPKPGEAVSIHAVKDGTDHTIRLIEAKPSLARPWLKPGGDLEFDPAHPEKLLESLPEHDLIVGFCDGHVETWKDRPSAEVLKALVTPNGGEKVEHPK